MLDFFVIKERMTKGVLDIYPEFMSYDVSDLITKGGKFYAVWDESKNLWSKDFNSVGRIVDKELIAYRNKKYPKDQNFDFKIHISSVRDFSTGNMNRMQSCITTIPSVAVKLDDNVIFKTQPTNKDDLASKKLTYDIDTKGDCPAFDKLISTLYEPDERAKLEWAIGSVFCGDSKWIQKFMVLFGDIGSGKSTILKVVDKLFEGYTTTIDAKSFVKSTNDFATSVFQDNPLIGIQYDGDLSHIQDNSLLNSITSHEPIIVNQKYRDMYNYTPNCLLFMCTNKPVEITDSKSGLLRRVINVAPSGKLLPTNEYFQVMNQIKFEYGAIAQRCIKVYKTMGPHYYDNYRPVDMIYRTNMIFNFISDNFETFDSEDLMTLKQAYDMFKQYCEDSNIRTYLRRYEFRDELKEYFDEFDEFIWIQGKSYRSVYTGFKRDKVLRTEKTTKPKELPPAGLELNQTDSIFDRECADLPAQYATSDGHPLKAWDNVTTTLKDLDTSRLHYVRVPENHIVLDFDIKDDKGEKDAQKNLTAAASFPPTYAEFSKGGAGVHLHYIYDGDPTELKRIYAPEIEIKVFSGKSSLRRRFTYCNNLPINHISEGLPIKEVRKVIDQRQIASELGLRKLIERNLRKEIHPGTKPSIDFICKILDEAYENVDLHYDVSDMRPQIIAFGNNSTHWADYCLKVIGNMKFKSREPAEASEDSSMDPKDGRIVFYDVEVFPNLFLVNWKYDGSDQVIRMINPSAHEIGELMKMKLVGFNCRRYDNHILYARYLGWDNQKLYDLSQSIVSSGKGRNKTMFGEAYNISYTDVFDFAMTKQSLKKWEIQLGIHHQELGLPWDQPVDESLWEKVAEYCDNDVIATEKVFHACKEDWAARNILAQMSGLSVNDTTNSHTARIIFGKEKEPWTEFNYTDLATGDVYPYPLVPDWMK